ncbi:rCG54798, partial [Rattus norvegicus]
MKEGPQVFSTSDENKNKTCQEEVPVYVSKWMPFKEQIIMLQASLQEIGDGWAVGKGPLTTAFPSCDIKALYLFLVPEHRKK